MLQKRTKWSASYTRPICAPPVLSDAIGPVQPALESLVQTFYASLGMHQPESGSVTIRWEKGKGEKNASSNL